MLKQLLDAQTSCLWLYHWQKFHTNGPPHRHVALGTVLIWTQRKYGLSRAQGLDNVVVEQEGGGGLRPN